MTSPMCALLSDSRLYDLFGDDQNLTVSQIWLLEIEWEDSSELRFLYGRSLSGNYQSNSWSGSVSSKMPLTENCSVRTHALTLHTSTERLSDLTQQ